MKSLKEALVHKHMDLSKKYVPEQWDIIETKDDRFWCVLTDLKDIAKIFPIAKTGKLGGCDIRDGIMIYYDKDRDEVWVWNPLNMYDGTKFGGYEEYDMVSVWKRTNKYPITNLIEFLKKSNLRNCTTNDPKYKKYKLI